MKLVRFLGLAAMLSVLAGCNAEVFGGGADCGSDEAQQLIDQLVKEELEFAVQSELDSSKELGSYDATQLENAIDRIKLRVEDVRSSQDSPGSSRLSCRATLLIALPKAVESTTNEARALAEMGTVRDIANRYKVKRRSGKYASEFEYFVQPTDDGSKLFAEIDGNSASLDFLGEVLGSYLLADEIRDEKIKADRAKAEEERQEREADQAVNAEAAAALKAAKVERKLASDAIGAVWDAMPEGAKKSINELHEAWIGEMTAKCAAEAAGSDERAAMREATKLECETRLVRNCASALQRNTPSAYNWTYCKVD
jgi:hypothetical protein